ncbi:Agamous-like MADS-box protein AGL65 [Camellia lanceoleosa]|uniref:Agamous-like MADS-box protein AGL65 n=1 Tax=Camellia lanceoleosa TaxID=1840588 RepID=A0ACC0IVI2_9ERIC|nr:Agamous-like MADS-box protein AGL65 [Camellia lanceoleosa]
MLKTRDRFKEATTVYFVFLVRNPYINLSSLEQASYCYLFTKPPMLRKYGFHLVLSGDLYKKCDQMKHAIRTYRGALTVFKGTKWSHIGIMFISILEILAMVSTIFCPILCSLTSKNFILFSHMQKIMKKYNLREKVQGQHQTYALGIKEVWEIDSSKHEPGHKRRSCRRSPIPLPLGTLGWPFLGETISFISCAYSDHPETFMDRRRDINIEEVITKFTQLTPQERTKRKLESLEALKKTFKKLNHDVNIQDFLGSSIYTMGQNASISTLFFEQARTMPSRSPIPSAVLLHRRKSMISRH